MVLLVYDWLFIGQYLSAGLMLPIALNLDLDQEGEQR